MYRKLLLEKENWPVIHLLIRHYCMTLQVGFMSIKRVLKQTIYKQLPLKSTYHENILHCRLLTVYAQRDKKCTLSQTSHVSLLCPGTLDLNGSNPITVLVETFELTWIVYKHFPLDNSEKVVILGQKLE